MFSPIVGWQFYLTCPGNHRHVSSRRGIFLLDPTSAVRVILGRTYYHVNNPPHHNACVSPILSLATSFTNKIVMSPSFKANTTYSSGSPASSGSVTASSELYASQLSTPNSGIHGPLPFTIHPPTLLDLSFPGQAVCTNQLQEHSTTSISSTDLDAGKVTPLPWQWSQMKANVLRSSLANKFLSSTALLLSKALNPLTHKTYSATLAQ